MSQDIAIETVLLQAFHFMEMTPPASFDDDSERARAARLMYAPALETVLEGYDWSFARRVAVLPAYTPPAPDIADPDLAYAVQLPADCLALRRVYDDAGLSWRLDQDMLRLDREPPVTVRYTARITREKYLPATVRTAIAAQLAVSLTPRFVTTRTKREAIAGALAEAIATARQNDAFTASAARLDGRETATDWADEATS